MRGVAYAFVALTFAATMPHPVAAQCYGPECDRHRSSPPAYYDERPARHSNSGNNGQPYRSAPYDQGRPNPPTPYAQPNFQHSQPNFQQPQPNFQHPQPNFQHAQPNFQQPQPNFQQPQPSLQHPQPNFQHARPNFQQPRPNFQRPGYQAQPRPPIDYADRPAGIAPPARDFRQARPEDRIEHRTQVTKIPKAARHAVRRRQPALNSRQVARDASTPAGAGQVTISMAEYRDLQSQARELQRRLSVRAGAPNRRSVFPDVHPSATGKPTRL